MQFEWPIADLPRYDILINSLVWGKESKAIFTRKRGENI